MSNCVVLLYSGDTAQDEVLIDKFDICVRIVNIHPVFKRVIGDGQPAHAVDDLQIVVVTSPLVGPVRIGLEARQIDWNALVAE